MCYGCMSSCNLSCMYFSQYPGVGKTTLAFALAKRMRYALVCKDDVRDIAVRHDAKTTAEIAARHPGSTMRVDSNEMTYEVMFAVGLTQLRVGAPGVVLESPLGRVALGERAVGITKEVNALCILVDCVAERSVWEARLAERKDYNAASHRPTSVDQILRHYENIHYEMKNCDAHVLVDCGRPSGEGVENVKNVIDQLIIDESGSLDPKSR